MTIKIYRPGNGDWDTNDKWSTASGTSPGDQDTTFPTAGDDVIFDSNSGNCTLDANAACDSIAATAAGAYSGTFSAAGFDMDVGGNCELESGTWTMGVGTWNVAGGMQHANATNWIGDGATLDFDGSGSFSWTQINDASDRAANIIVRAGVTLTPASQIYATNYDIYGTVPLGSGSNNLRNFAGEIKVRSGGEISGTGTTFIQLESSPNTKGFTLNEGTVSVSQIRFVSPITTAGETALIAPGTYDADVKVSTFSGTSATAKSQLSTVAGTVTITGDLWILDGSGDRDVEFTNVAGCVLNIGGDLLIDDISTSAGGIVEFDNSANNQTMTISGDITMTTLGTGTVTFTESGAGGDIALDGAATYTGDIGEGSLGDVTVTNGNSLAVASAMDVAGFTGEPNCSVTGAFLLTVGDNFALDGTSGNTITFNGPDLDVTGTAEAHFTTATNSDASAGEEVDALDNCTDGGGNSNWDFEQSSSSSSATSSSQTSSSSSSSSSSSIVAGQAVSTSQLMLMGVGT